jgi:hypothetical protein
LLWVYGCDIGAAPQLIVLNIILIL